MTSFAGEIAAARTRGSRPDANVVRSPAERLRSRVATTAQQIRNATMDGEAPAVLLRDRDDKFGSAFDRAAQSIGAKVIRTAVRAPNMNAVSERFVGSVRRELLDHVLLVDDLHLASLLRQYARCFNESRPHQGSANAYPRVP